MRIIQQEFLPNRQNASNIASVDLDAVPAVQVVRALERCAQEPRPLLLVDAANLQCLRTLGVSHVVSELLVLRQSGADVWLRNASPALRRCLQLLKLDAVFHLHAEHEAPKLSSAG
ncbi:STAS domain-containing protein [Solirubrum puertoriconensis]|uniref:STAS domain-containing protein n=1 Tax=Solirubrum puertoriconensis TaxID=1751427 RepID=A0A9X0HMB8_SOLP1|nr:STAS domain-containing protein [Solirubrum puertoriconensis]KUG08589.1 hypothetical protein ASU33_10580 [Solirubrum puertoriconensis]